MPSINYSDELKTEYDRLFNTCDIRTEKLQVIEKVIKKINDNKSRYDTVAVKLNIPW